MIIHSYNKETGKTTVSVYPKETQEPSAMPECTDMPLSQLPLEHEIRYNHLNHWTPTQTETLLLPYTRINISIENNPMFFSNESSEDKEFMDGLMGTIGQHLSTDHDMQLMAILAQRLKEWHIQGKRTDTHVLDFLEGLVNQFKK